MSNVLKFLMRKRSTWQKAAAERGGHVYVYGHHYFGFAVKVKLQGNANIERNLIDRIDQVMQQDNENLFFQYFVDKEKNYYLVVMYEALEKKFEVNEKKILEFTIYDWSCKNEENVFYLSTNGMFGVELLKKYDREEDMHFPAMQELL